MLSHNPLIFCDMAKIISRVKEFATSERVKNVTKGILKGAAVVAGIVVAYKVGESAGKHSQMEQINNALGDIACSKYGKHCGVNEVDIYDALNSWIKPDDVLNFVKDKIS